MRTLLAPLVLVVLTALAGCGDGSGAPTSSADPVTASPTQPATGSTPTPSAEVEAAAAVAVAYADAMREHDAGAIYDLAWSGLREGISREDFVESGMDLDGVTNARLSGVVRVGWSEDGQRAAIAPVIVTSDEIPQIGRVVLLEEDGQWRFFNQVGVGEEPVLTDEPPARSRR